ncbi:MAG: phospholipase D-like domain-containing protein [Thermoproteota archaeon]|nr:phospholipase D-like domain-containing protein [Thermoproteota archaeon]
MEQLKQQKDLKIIIVGPMKPNLPNQVLAFISKESANDITNNLRSLRKAGGNRVRTYSLISQHPSIPQKRRQIYVHSKILIVDDCWITIGSANMDKKGFRDSIELDFGITSPKLACQIRTKLWNEHLNTSQKDLFPEDVLRNFHEGFNAWDKLASENGKRVQNKEPIQGHVYYNNFEEQGIPSPLSNPKQ